MVSVGCWGYVIMVSMMGQGGPWRSGGVWLPRVLIF